MVPYVSDLGQREGFRSLGKYIDEPTKFTQHLRGLSSHLNIFGTKHLL